MSLFWSGKNRIWSVKSQGIFACHIVGNPVLNTNSKMLISSIFNYRLATVYTSTTADIKRTILRMLEVPVSNLSLLSVSYFPVNRILKQDFFLFCI